MKNLLILSNSLKQQNIEKKFNLVFAGLGLRETIKSYNNKKEFIAPNIIIAGGVGSFEPRNISLKEAEKFEKTE